MRDRIGKSLELLVRSLEFCGPFDDPLFELFIQSPDFLFNPLPFRNVASHCKQGRLPLEGTVLLTVADKDKPAIVDVGRRFAELGFTLKDTGGTREFLAEHGIQSEPVHKIMEGRPHVADRITDGEIQLVINTPMGKASKEDDSYIRKAAIRYKVPYITTVAAAMAAAKGIAACQEGRPEVRSLQSYHADIT